MKQYLTSVKVLISDWGLNPSPGDSRGDQGKLWVIGSTLLSPGPGS